MRRITDTFLRRAAAAVAAAGVAVASIAIAASSPTQAGVDAGTSVCFESAVPPGGGMVVNGTAARATERGFLNFYAPAEGADPTANSSVNFEVGPAIANSVVVPVVSDRGEACAYTSAEVDVIADVSGYLDPAAMLLYESGQPVRIYDSRRDRPFDAGETFCFPPANNADVGEPYLANLTVAGAEAPGFANLYPKGAIPDATSVINFVPGRNIANGVIVTAGQDTEICLYTSVRTHLILDLIGAVDATRYRPAQPDNSPVRRVDTRQDRPMEPGESRCLDTDAAPGEAVALTVTAVRSAGAGFLNVFPESDVADPDGNSSVNFRDGANFANGIIVLAGTDGEVCVYASEVTDVLIDVTGFFTPGTFVPLNDDGSADRVLDTR